MKLRRAKKDGTVRASVEAEGEAELLAAYVRQEVERDRAQFPDRYRQGFIAGARVVADKIRHKVKEGYNQRQEDFQ